LNDGTAGDPRSRAALLRDRLRDEDLEASSWSNGPYDVYGAHDHGYDKVLLVADGSITFGLPTTGDAVAMHSGDRLDLPAGTVHDAQVGPDGVTCLEAHAPRGRLAGLAHHPAGSW
jgi:uncharacterized protein YjlB